MACHDERIYELRTATGAYQHVSEADLLEALEHASKTYFDSGPLLQSAGCASKWIQGAIAFKDHERFVAVWLSARHEVIAFDELARGSVDRAVVYPRTVIKQALIHNAAAVIFAHNHPSGCCEPSASDLQLTDRLKNLLNEIDVRVLDHLVVGATSVSMAERGLL